VLHHCTQHLLQLDVGTISMQVKYHNRQSLPPLLCSSVCHYQRCCWRRCRPPHTPQSLASHITARQHQHHEAASKQASKQAGHTRLVRKLHLLRLQQSSQCSTTQQHSVIFARQGAALYRR
jgi:hypothetical protein